MKDSVAAWRLKQGNVIGADMRAATPMLDGERFPVVTARFTRRDSRGPVSSTVSISLLLFLRNMSHRRTGVNH